jgi:hypothetical protein
MTRHVLRLLMLSAFAVASQGFAAASAKNIRLAMGPISAAQKNQGARPAPETTDTGATAQPRHHPRHHHHHSTHRKS